MDPDRQLQRFTSSDLSPADCVERFGPTTSGHSYTGISASGSAIVLNGDLYAFPLYATDAGPATKRLRSEHASFKSRQQSETLRKEFLDRVRFPEMFERQESLKKNTPGTYEWVFTRGSPFPDMSGHAAVKDRELRGRILAWLRNTGSLFWIKGKPGSGKSSLMSFVLQDQRIKTNLQAWAGDRAIHVFSFFFWKAGSDLQKTIPGLLRSLLWQLGKSKSTAIDEMVTHNPLPSLSAWTEPRLNVALDQMLEAFQDDRILFLIDGLDECEDDHSDLINLIRRLGSNGNVKICLSSRPEIALTMHLGALPNVSLQHLNFIDILIHARTAFKPCGKPLEDFSSNVARDAEGVFLWAVLVCKSLVRGHTDRDDETILRKRLAAFPRGLEGLFARMFSEIDDVHHDSLKFYLHSVGHDNSVALIAATLHRHRVSNLEDFAEVCKNERIRIVSQSRGLIEVNDPKVRLAKYPVKDWALKDISNGGPRQDSIDLSESQLLQEYMALTLQWVHRSAYEYIHGASRTANVFKMHHIEEDRRNRNLWQGALWLAQFLPIISLSHKVHNGPLAISDTQGCSLERPYFTECDKTQEFAREIEHGLNTMHDTICSWMREMQQRNSVDELLVSEYPSLFHGARTTPLSSPMYWFWRMVVSTHPEYLTHHLDKFLQEPNMEFMLSGVIMPLLSSWSMQHPKSKIDEQCLVVIRSISTGIYLESHDYHPRTNCASVRLAECQHRFSRKFYTWQSSASDIPDDKSILTNSMQAMIGFWQAECMRRSSARKGSRTDSVHLFEQHTPRDFFAKIFDLLDGWHVFVGMLHCWDYAREPLMDIQLPIRYSCSSLLLGSCQPNINPLNLVAARLVVRLCCVKRHKLIKTEFPPKIFASHVFDLSKQGSERLIKLLSQSTKVNATRNVHEVVLMFTGTFTEFHRCIKMILDEIWEDTHDQLTAWGRLYCRACVRKYFECYWLDEEDT